MKPAQTEWAAPILFVPKKDATFRFWEDYCKQDAVAKRDSYPILCMDECIDSLSKTIVSLSLDANRGFGRSKLKTLTKSDLLYSAPRLILLCPHAPCFKKCCWHIWVYYGRDSTKCQIANRTCLPKRHHNVQQDTRTTNRPPTQSHFASIQCRSHAGAQEV